MQTGAGRAALVMSVGDVVAEVPDENRKFFRYLADTERLLLQGFPPALIKDLLCKKTLAKKATGNAYSKVLIVATVHPMLKTIADNTVKSFADWDSTFQSSFVDIDMLNLIKRQLLGNGRTLEKKPKRAMKAMKARRQARRSK